MLKAKRKWVGDQLRELENLRLLKREDRPGRHPRITVLRDDGSGRPFDDPDGSPNNTYVTILGGIIASGALAEWTTAQLAFYLFAMVAERHDRRYRPGETEPGSGSWFRPLTWISDPTQRHRGAVLIPFKEATLERGRAAFENEGLITVVKSRYDPVTRQRFQSGTRNLYTNRFDTLTQAARISARYGLALALILVDLRRQQHLNQGVATGGWLAGRGQLSIPRDAKASQDESLASQRCLLAPGSERQACA